jgi:hypothetical protein
VSADPVPARSLHVVAILLRRPAVARAEGVNEVADVIVAHAVGDLLQAHIAFLEQAARQLEPVIAQRLEDRRVEQQAKAPCSAASL